MKKNYPPIENKVNKHTKLVKQAKSGTKKQLKEAELQLQKINLEVDLAIPNYFRLMKEINNTEQLSKIE